MHAVTVESQCPYCGEPLTLQVDEFGGRRQSYVEDCAVCCQAVEITVSIAGEEADVSVRRQDD